MALRSGTIAALDNVVGVSDMCLLEPLDEDNFLENLSHRFDQKQIYVSSFIALVMLDFKELHYFNLFQLITMRHILKNDKFNYEKAG